MLLCWRQRLDLVHAASPRPGASSPRPAGHMRPNAKSYTYIKHEIFFSVSVGVCVFNVEPKTALLLPVWPRDATRLDVPAGLWPVGDNVPPTFLLGFFVCLFVFWCSKLRRLIFVSNFVRFSHTKISARRGAGAVRTGPALTRSCATPWGPAEAQGQCSQKTRRLVSAQCCH